MTETVSQPSTGLPKAFLFMASVVAIIVIGFYSWIASVDWFLSDDFAFLQYVQGPWSWKRVFFPIEKRFWWAYRPLGMDTYFYLSFKLFGWNAQGYYGITIITHLLTSVFVYRLGRQFGLGIHSSIVAALLGVSRYPSISTVSMACCYHYVAAGFFFILALSLFFDFIHRKQVKFQFASCLAFILGLLCNEIILVLPLLLLLIIMYEERFRLAKSVIKNAILKVLPFALLAGIFLIFRYLMIAEVERPSLYNFRFDRHILSNCLANIYIMVGGQYQFFIECLLVLLMAISVYRWSHKYRSRLQSNSNQLRDATFPNKKHCNDSTVSIPVEPDDRIDRAFPTSKGRRSTTEVAAHQIGKCWTHRNIVIISWVFSVLIVLSSLPFPQERFAMSIQIPIALLYAITLDAFLLIYIKEYRRILEITVVALILVSLPWQQVQARAAFSRGVYMRELQRVVLSVYPELPNNAVIRILYGGEDRATKAIANEFRAMGYGNAVIQARFLDRKIHVQYIDIKELDLYRIWCRNCLYFNLRPSLQLQSIGKQELTEQLKSDE